MNRFHFLVRVSVFLGLAAVLHESAKAQIIITPIQFGVEAAKPIDHQLWGVTTFDYRDPRELRGPSKLYIYDLYLTGYHFSELEWRSSNGYEFWLAITNQQNSQLYYASSVTTAKKMFIEFGNAIPQDESNVNIHLWTRDWLNNTWIRKTYSAEVVRSIYVEGAG